MKTSWAWMFMAVVLMVGNLGCYYDQWQAAERDNRILREDLSRAQQDLADAEMMLRQRETTIDGLNNQLAAKDQTIGTLTAEVQNLRQAMDKAQAILEAQAGKALQPLTIVKQALPEPLHQELANLAEAYPDQIEYLPENGALRWKSDLLFPLGSDELSTSEQTLAALAKFAEIVQSEKATGFDVVVVGHTDTTPIRKPATLAKFPNNWYLSAARAIRVMDMMSKDGIPMERMGIMGYGKFRPIADNSTPEGKAKNRRVEIYLVPKGSVQAVSQGVMQTNDQRLVFVPATLCKDGRL